MRRLTRIQRLRAVQRIPLQPHLRIPTPARALSTTSVRPFQNTRHLPEETDKKRQEMLEALERDRKSALELQEEPIEDAQGAEEGVGVDEARISVPPDFTYAPPPKQLEDYMPATTVEELEPVGGLEGWWDQEGHWGEADQLYVFARRKVADDTVKEVLLRQAVVECLAVMAKGKGELLGARWRFDRECVMRAASVQVDIGEDGDVTLKGDLGALVEGLQGGEEAVEPQDAAGDRIAEGDGVRAENVLEENANENAAASENVEEDPVQEEASNFELLPADEAREMLKSQSPAWKKVSLADPQYKFAVHKRLYQLTGHYVHDAKLAPIKTADRLLTTICTLPKAKTLVDEIQRRQELLQLPNVKVYNRRVTPIDKEIWVGRWKVIEDELKKRGLPATGRGTYGKHTEGPWLRGKK